ncbi:mobilization protein [Candidatus Williamhamiltonella defendens]|uniref:mobilization protein n=1 Tax=Candidatus Williamhamiltonella defendens TaxID=138072 RepID=UPI00130D5C6B|nr:mobilization protein [Candidatus Hamiltonella defensa]
MAQQPFPSFTDTLVRASPRHPIHQRNQNQLLIKNAMSSIEKRKNLVYSQYSLLFIRKKLLQENKKVSGLRLGEYLIRCKLKRRIKSRVELELVMEFSHLGYLQRTLFNEGNGVLSQKYAEIFVVFKKLF